VTLQSFSDCTVMPAALAGGAIDCTLTTYERVATAADPSCGGDAVVAARTISTISDLTGRKVAYTACRHPTSCSPARSRPTA
jgi:hypothetical protein